MKMTQSEQLLNETQRINKQTFTPIQIKKICVLIKNNEPLDMTFTVNECNLWELLKNYIKN